MSSGFESDYYAKNYRNYQAQNPPRKLRFYREIIEKYAPATAPRRIHDIGCAFAAMLGSLDASWEIFGSDVSKFAIERAQQKYPRGNFLVSEAAEIAPRENYFSAVTAFDVLEHVPDLAPVAASVNRQLVSGGVFVFVVPVYDGLCGPIINALDRDLTHLHKWPRQRWLDWAAAHFELIEWQGIVRYLLPGEYYLHHPTQLFRKHAPAIIVACRKRDSGVR